MFFRIISVLALFFFAVTRVTAAENSAKNTHHLPKVVRASWYGPQFHGKLMANGKPFNMYDMTVAHKTLPLHAWVRLRNPENGKEILVPVTDRGPYKPGREFDLSYAAAHALGVVAIGVAPLQVVKVYL